MLPSLWIKNFRIFKNLKIERLGKVNLFAGKNSTGKSCLLEAVHFFVSGGSLSVLKKIISFRDEDFKIWEGGDEESLESLKYVFSGYKLPEVGDEGVFIGQDTVRKKFIRLYMEAYRMNIDDKGGVLVSQVFSLDDVEQENFITLENENGSGPLLPFYPGYRSRVHISSYDSKVIKIQSVSPKNEESFNVSALWDNINMTDMEKEVVDAINLIRCNITGIALVGNRLNRSERYEIVRLKGFDERVPMKSLGDGVVRIFHIILALVNVKDGVLLIDEAENGLHWGIHKKLWEIVFRLADQLNVQVFATTHSQDCVRGFHSAWSKQKELGGFYRLSKDPEHGVKCTPYSCENLSDSLESGVEMR